MRGFQRLLRAAVGPLQSQCCDEARRAAGPVAVSDAGRGRRKRKLFLARLISRPQMGASRHPGGARCMRVGWRADSGRAKRRELAAGRTQQQQQQQKSQQSSQQKTSAPTRSGRPAVGAQSCVQVVGVITALRRQRSRWPKFVCRGSQSAAAAVDSPGGVCISANPAIRSVRGDGQYSA